MMLPRIALAIVLVVVGQCVDGNQRIIQVSCEELFAKDDDFLSSGSSGGGGLRCCMHENCSCNSLDDALDNLTSNVLINITTDVMLSFIPPVYHVENISIIGHNNPTVHCRSIGGIDFAYCNNCVIRDITWDGCGTESTDATTQPGIKFTYSSNVTIQNCSFKHSVGQAVVLSEISGEVSITQSEFISNTHYRGHGAALHYSQNSVTNSSSLLFIISNCNFISNKLAESLVYLGKPNSKHIGNVTLYNSTFYYNQGVSIYVVNQNFHLKGKNLFQENRAHGGAGLFITDHSAITFGENSNVVFTKNSAISYGGAIFLRDHSNVLFDQNAKVSFNNNHAHAGTIYSVTSSNILFKANCVVRFSSNSAERSDATIYSDSSHVLFTGNSKVTFNNSYYDRAITSKNSSISFDGNSSTAFFNNIDVAIWLMQFAFIFFDGDSSTTFSSNGNTAMYSLSHNTIFFKGNSSTVFINNGDGAIYTLHDISFEESSTVSFSNNIARVAIISCDTISFKGNSSATFSNNSGYDGGAIYCDSLSFEESSTVSFSNNSAIRGGGAINCDVISFEGNSTTQFHSNIAEDGGAMYSRTVVSFMDNSKAIFNNNTANYNGGAIYSQRTHLYFKNFSTVVFKNNIADYGGAVFAETHSNIIFSDNATVKFNKNKAIFDATIYSSYKSKITVKDDFNVTFDDIPAKWCFNTCFPYTRHPDTVTIDSNSLVWCSNQEAFECPSNKCHCNDLKNSFSNSSVININITDKMMILSSDISLYHLGNVSIVGVNNLTILCLNGSSLTVDMYDALRIEGITWVRCGGGRPVINLVSIRSISVRIQKCSFQYSLASAIGWSIGIFGPNFGPFVFSFYDTKFDISHCNFINSNHHRGQSHGAAMYFSWKFYALTLELNNCNFINNGPGKSIIHFFNIDKTSSSVHINKCNFQNNQGIPVYISNHLSLHIGSETLFENNKAENGAGIYLSDNSTVVFDETSNAKFNNNYVERNGAGIILYNHSSIIFAQGSVVKFNDNKAINGTIYSKASSRVTFMATCEVTFNGNSATQYGAAIYSVENSHIVFTGNSKVSFTNNVIPFSDTQKQLGGTIFSERYGSVSFEGNSITTFSSNTATFGAAIFSLYDSGIIFKDNSRTTFNGNSATQCGAAIYSSHIVFTGNSKVSFTSNVIPFSDTQKQLGGTIFSERYGSVSFEGNSITTFSSNTATFGAAIFSLYDSGIIFKGNSRTTFNGNSATQYGAAIYSVESSYIVFTGNSKVSFTNNVIPFSDIHQQLGGAIFSETFGYVSFEGNSTTMFNSNTATFGAAIFSLDDSSIIFKDNSRTTFDGKMVQNKAINGTIYSKASSNVTFMATCEVTFNGNSATQYGAAIYSVENSHIVFNGNSKVSFTNNVIPFSDTHQQLGGTIFSETFGYVSFEGNSTTVFNSNAAIFGAGIFSLSNSSINFKDNSRTIFSDNIVQNCGALASALFSTVTFNDNAKVNYSTNTALRTYESSAGAICSFDKSDIAFLGNSFVRFVGNRADRGGAVVSSESNIILEKHSTVHFDNNTAPYSSGGAFLCSNSSNVTIKGNSAMSFYGNKANQNGGAIHLYNKSKIIVKENSTASFIDNNARQYGGAVFCDELSKITFEGRSMATFHYNTAENGGAVYFTNSNVTVNESSLIKFYNNEARQNGGIGYINFKSNVMFEGITTVIFYNNCALYGGGIFVNDHSNITLSGSSNLSFVSNNATRDGGAGYFGPHCSFIVKENVLLTFSNNTALHGGAIYISDKISSLLTGNSTVLFYENSAIIGGGAVSISNYASLTLKDHITVNFTDNSAQYGGAVYLDTTSHMVNHSDKDCLSFSNNIAQFKGNEVYQDVADSCNSSCLNSTIFGINNELIDTPPYQLQFYDPAVCIDNDTDSQCSNYYIHNVMLGREIILPACVLDYYKNEINDSTQFLVEDKMHKNYTVVGPTKILISCDTFRGLSITSYEILTTSKNYSVKISLNVDHNSGWKQISVNLIVGLLPCHPGFWQYPKSVKCECYDAKSIVFCSSNGSTIKGGYWFGSVDGNPTITLCPINYCNFTCCETVNGYYHLSPVRDNQCQSHRSGIACGSCTDGYTLSFDSTECVNVDSCLAGQTVLVTLLTVMYWIVMVTVVFALMYYKVGIGYLYGITYYYSILDIFLNQNLQTSKGLQLTVNIISSFSKITPQFLGELCLTTGMSGIDQQFIHYMHPLAIILILVAISLLAKRSRRISTFISRGIIHVICLLLLLSYTSVVSTSLLLIRSLTFHEIDKVYTYLSPDIEYFQGRHLAYGILALLCMVSIVIGLPLLLTLEPILNQKFSFVKIKPLLDQFQGCYKDKYRCFAGYYMICRLVVITIVIANSSNDFAVNYIVSAACGIIALLHLTLKPYNNEILNKFDGVILLLCGLTSALRLSDNFDSPFVITTTLVLVILPLVIFIAMVLFLHKDDFKRMVAYFASKHESPNRSNDASNNEVPMKEFLIIVDDSRRKNATICDVREFYAGSNSYRESLFDAMDEIESMQESK